MALLYTSISLFLLLMLAVGVIRVVRGPTDFDRMIAAQLFGTTAVAILCLLAEAGNQPALRSVALVFALLSAITAVTFVRHRMAGDE
jgi:multicomponent Na+:H+ antiporter subunit F